MSESVCIARSIAIKAYSGRQSDSFTQVDNKPSTIEPMVETKTAQYIELHLIEKEKRTRTRKLKIFLSKSKGCRVVKSTTGSQCKLTRNKHGMVTRLTC